MSVTTLSPEECWQQELGNDDRIRTLLEENGHIPAQSIRTRPHLYEEMADISFCSICGMRFGSSVHTVTKDEAIRVIQERIENYTGTLPLVSIKEVRDVLRIVKQIDA